MTVPSLRVCVVTTSYPRWPSDDAAVFVERLVNGFETVGIEGDVVVPLDQTEQVIERRGSFVIRRFRYGFFKKGKLAFGSGILPNLRRSPSLWFQVPSLLVGLAIGIRRARSVRVVHANWLFSAVAAWSVHFFGGPPVVVTCRGEDAKLLNVPIVGRFLTAILKRCSAVITVSEGLRTAVIATGIPESKVHHIPNGVDVQVPSQAELEAWAAKNRFPLTTKWLISIGRVIPLKRIHDVIQLLSKPELAEFSLVICGRLDDKHYVSSIRALLRDSKLEDRVRLEGAVAPKDIPFYLKASRYFVSLSEYEGRPNAVVEAMAAGLPPIVSNIPAHRELVWDGKTGAVVSNNEQAADVIRQLEQDPHRYTSVSNNARGAVASYGWGDAARRYREVFEAAISGGRLIVPP